MGAPLLPLGQSVWPHLHSPLPAWAQCLWSAARGAAPLPPLMWSHWGNSLFGGPQALQSRLPPLGCVEHNLPRPRQTSPQPR